MAFVERPAPPDLSPFVMRLWYLDIPPPRRLERILPQPYVHVIVNLSQPYRLLDRHGAARPVQRAFVSGIQPEYLVIENPPRLRHVCAELSPTGVRALSDVPPTSLTGQVIDAERVFPGLCAAVVTGGGTATSALDAFAGYLSGARRAERFDPLVERALDSIQQNPLRHMGRFAAGEGISHKTLIARFTAACGITPKAYAQVWRFHRFVTDLPIGAPLPTWADLAAESSYYDQPQVIRAFRRYSGFTPAEYLRRVRDFGPEAASFIPLDDAPSASG